MKKLISLILSLMLLPVAASYGQISNPDNFNVQDGVLMHYSGWDAIVHIPGDLGITTIGPRAFAFRPDIVQVIIPEGVTAIHNMAFTQCQSLEMIMIPSSVNDIQGGFIMDCPALTTIDVAYGSYAYSFTDGVLYAFGKTRLVWYSPAKTDTDFSIPSGVEYISGYAFANCLNLESVSIPGSVGGYYGYGYQLGQSIFAKCSNLKDIYVEWTTPLTLSDYNYAFEEFSQAACTLHVPIGTKPLYESAFGWKDFGTISAPPDIEVTGVVLNKSVEQIEITNWVDLIATVSPSNATHPDVIWTSSDQSVATVNAYGGVKGVGLGTATITATAGDGSFSDACEVTVVNNRFIIENGVLVRYINPNSGWLELTIPGNLGITEIGDGCFAGMYNIKVLSLTIPEGVKRIGKDAFNGCANIGNIPGYGMHLTFPGTLEIIDDRAFQSCHRIYYVTLPKSLKKFGVSAFENCGYLRSINVVEDNPDFSSLNGILYNKDKTSLIAAPCNGNNFYGNRFVIPNTVTRIEPAAFASNPFIHSLTIPASVQFIGERAIEFNPYITLTVNWNTPLVINSNIFTGAGDIHRSTLHVPCGSKALYEASEGWKYFGTIVESECITPPFSTWTAGGSDLNWNNPNNWSPKAVPGEITRVHIPKNTDGKYPLTTAEYKITSLTFEHGASLNLGAKMTVSDSVKVNYTVKKNKWYAIGFPFPIRSVFSHYFESQDWEPFELVAFEQGVGGDYWLKEYNGDKFIYTNQLSSGKGYIIQFPEWFDGTVISFISEPAQVLTSSGILDVGTSYKLTANPTVGSLTLNVPDGNKHYLKYDQETNNFTLLQNQTTLPAFETFMSISEPNRSMVRSSIGEGSEEESTGLDPIVVDDDPNDPVKEVHYYTLQGVEISRPDEAGIYIAKKIYKSGKERSTKIIKQSK